MLRSWVLGPAAALAFKWLRRWVRSRLRDAMVPGPGGGARLRRGWRRIPGGGGGLALGLRAQDGTLVARRVLEARRDGTLQGLGAGGGPGLEF